MVTYISSEFGEPFGQVYLCKYPIPYSLSPGSNGKDENLFGNTGACKRLEVLELGFAQGQLAPQSALGHELI